MPKATPQRVQPVSRSVFADGEGGSAPVTPPKKNGFQRAKPKPKPPQAAANKPKVDAAGRQRMLTPEQQENLREAEAAEAQVEQAEEAAPAKRSGRVPFGNQSAKMAIPEREGFTRRWFNDKPGRIQRALDAGYKLVENPLTKAPYELTVNQSAQKNDAMKAYAMEIPNEFYDEDFALKQESLDITDDAIYHGTFKEERGDKRYVPADTMKFSTKRGPGSHIA